LIYNFKEDLKNLIIFSVGAASALIINIFLIFVDPFLLGKFNKIYAFYIVLSQFFLFSLNDNLVRNTPIINSEKKNSYFSAVIFTLIIILLLQFFFFLIIRLSLNEYLIKKNLLDVLNILNITLPFFIINKVFFGYLNGLKKMQTYFFLNTLRPILILVSLICFYFSGSLSKFIGYSFFTSEIIILLTNIIIFWLSKPIIDFVINKKEILKIFKFCLLSWPHSFLSYSYIRIDILCLSFFASDEKIGIYSFAAMLIEGMYQLGTVMRDKANPLISDKIKKNTFKINLFFKSIIINLISIFIIFLTIYFLIFPIMNNFFQIKEISLIFLVLFTGLFFYSSMIIFENIFLMSNNPILQSLFVIFINTINLIMNLILIDKFSIYGAAYATCITFIVMTIILGFYVKSCTKQ